MIIETKRFAVQFPRRPDLSGRPLGFLLVVKGPPRGAGRFAPSGRSFGFYLPSLAWPTKTIFESVMFTADYDYLGNDKNHWPEMYRKAAERAVVRKLDEMPGFKVVKERTVVDRRVDLAGHPLQLLCKIEVAQAA